MPTKQRLRAEKAIKHTMAALPSKSTTVEKEQKNCSDYLSCCYDDQYKELKQKKNVGGSSTVLTPEMQRASQQGWSMIKTIIFPALPAIVQDLWVYLELLISVVAFILGLVDTFPIESIHTYNYSYLVLATVSMILALIDGFIYFFQLGSCARCIRDCRGNSTEHQPLEEEGDTAERKCCSLTEKQKEAFNSWFEFCRNILSELLLYPLLMFDLFDFIIGTGYIPEDHRGRTDFSLFVIGGFYLILSVYIMRILIVAGSMLSLARLPGNKEATIHKRDTFILVRFCGHILGQIGVHLMIILVIATKINNENPAMIVDGSKNNVTTEDDSMRASPFLITAIVLGWIIPLAGVFVFFIVNYYWMKEFSIGFWLNMISLLQGESFAETVFGGNGLSAAEEKALQFVEDTQYKQVKKQLLRFKSTPVWIKFFYPARIPITAITGLLYDILLLIFIVCLMLTYENGSVKLKVFTDDHKMTAMFIVSIIIIILANIHALILLNMILLMIIVIFALSAAIAVFLSPLLLLVYFPIVACLGFNLVFLDTKDMLKHKKVSETSNSTSEPSFGSDFATGLEIDTLESKA